MAVKIIARLLVSLALWLPLLYTLFFVIGCGLAGASLTALKSWYFAGLFVSLCGSFVISSYMYQRGRKDGKRAKSAGNIKKVKRAEDAQISAFDRRQNTDEPSAAQSVAGDSAEKTRPKSIVDRAREDGGRIGGAGKRQDGQSAPKQDKGAGQAETAEKHGFYTYQSEGFVSGYAQDKYGQGKPDGQTAKQDFGYGGDDYNKNNYKNDYGKSDYGKNDYNKNDYGRGDFDRPVSGDFGGIREHNSADYPYSKNDFESDLERSGGFGFDGNNGQSGGFDDFDVPVSGTRSFEEKPKVFATRADPTVFIYEYADRLEYYKRTRSGMVYMRSVPKVG